MKTHKGEALIMAIFAILNMRFKQITDRQMHIKQTPKVIGKSIIIFLLVKSGDFSAGCVIFRLFMVITSCETNSIYCALR